MDNTSQVSFSADALDRLNQTLSQYQISRIASISVPEFRGQPNEDVRDFLKRFKMATLSFDDRTRCVALNKALLGSAHTWAKENLKDAISKNDWKAAKKEIINRFALPDQELRHQQKLSRLKFDAKESTLMSYVEEYADTYRKAYREAKDADVIRSLRLNLPDEILLNLNILSDDWSTLESLGTLYPLIRRVESKIMPYESKEKAGTERADIASIANMLKELQSAIAKKEAEPAEAKPQESIAALRTRSQNLKGCDSITTAWNTQLTQKEGIAHMDTEVEEARRQTGPQTRTGYPSWVKTSLECYLVLRNLTQCLMPTETCWRHTTGRTASHQTLATRVEVTTSIDTALSRMSI